MATTTNFGWETPDDTDLVKDGAAAMRTLGNAIDTSLVDLKGGTTGQILSKASGTDLDYTWITPNPGDITGVTTTSPLTGGGTSGDVTVGIQDGTTSQKGAVQLEDSTSSTSTTKAATPNSVKTAYDLAAAALPASNGFFAGKNKIINGDFGINQRNFTSVSSDSAFSFDRWKMQQGGSGTLTITPQTFTPGAAPVTGYEATNFAQLVTASASGTTDYKIFRQPIESVRTFAGQTATISFWAKAASGTPKIALEMYQDFGSGGSTGVATYAGQVTLSTSWARYSVTVSIPSISGKTIGTSDALNLQFWLSAGSDFNSRTGSLGNQNATFSIWGVQLEAGSTATPFQTATGTKQGELSACQRYYWRTTASGNYDSFGWGNGPYTNGAYILITNPVTMRTAPTSIEYSGNLALYGLGSFISVTNIALDATNKQMNSVAVSSGTTIANAFYRLLANGVGNQYIGFSAEL